eukprot:8713283-Ditylum_brightwellii.AAC.1
MRCNYSKNKGHDGAMLCAPRASQPLIQREVVYDKLIQYSLFENKENDASMWCTPRASHSLIQHEEVAD